MKWLIILPCVPVSCDRHLSVHLSHRQHNVSCSIELLSPAVIISSSQHWGRWQKIKI